MNNFDYRLHKIIGVARKKYPGALHASIYPLGYQDKNFHFQPFTKNELKELFLYNGTAFGYKFPDYLFNELIILQLRENEIVDDHTKDVFSADYDTKITKYDHITIINTDDEGLKRAISQGNFNCYYKVSNRIYFITENESRKGIAKYWTIEDKLFDANRNICMCGEDVFLIRDDISYPFQYREIWSKEEIINFVIDLINDFKIDPQDIKTISAEIIQKISLPFHILKDRLEEFSSLLPSIVLTHKSIIDLASSSMLSDILQKSIKEYEDEYIKTYEDHHQELIKKLEQSKEQKLNNINEVCEQERKKSLSLLNAINDNINQAQVKLNEINEEIKVKENKAKALEQRFANIEGHKDRLKEDFSIIRDIISFQTCDSQKQLDSCIEIVACDGEAIIEFDDFISHIGAHLLKNKFSQDSAIDISKNISRLFVAKNHIGKNLSVILLPNLKIFKSLIDAIGQYHLCSIGVGPNWKSYDDLYYNAVGKMIISATNNRKPSVNPV